MKPPAGGPVTFHLVWTWAGRRWALDARSTLALFNR
jgi:hypothetical protein